MNVPDSPDGHPVPHDLLEIERLAVLDVGRASFLWMSSRPGLRHELFEQDADHDAGKHAQRA